MISHFPHAQDSSEADTASASPNLATRHDSAQKELIKLSASKFIGPEVVTAIPDSPKEIVRKEKELSHRNLKDIRVVSSAIYGNSREIVRKDKKVSQRNLKDIRVLDSAISENPQDIVRKNSELSKAISQTIE